MSNIFEQIVQSISLLAEDRASLKEKRGFTDDVIDKMKFRSCGEHLIEAYQGIWPKQIFSAMCKRNILIPYFDPSGRIIHASPHKFGFSGIPIQLYVPYPYLGSNTETMVIAESPFKALASCLMGVPAIGLNGIHSFSKNRFNEITDMLRALGTKNVVICFDNEIKNNPNYPNYKPDFTRRYDCEFRAYVISQLLIKEDFEVKIAILKNEWMKDGKADIDGVLAQKVDPKEYADVIASGITPYEYRKGWNLSSLHRSFMERSIDRFFYNGPISEKFNSYYVNTGKKDVKISNFTISIVHTLFNERGHAERLCKFKSNYGDSDTVVITPDIMASKMNFQKFCYEIGDYEFKGKEEDMQQIWRYIFMHQTGKTVFKLKHYGYHSDTGIWFFGNGAYKDDRFFDADEDGIVWVDDVGYKLLDALTDMDSPTLSNNENVNITIQDIFEKMSLTIGSNNAKTIMGWGLGSFFMPEILQTWGVYPFLFLFGKQQAGKSTIANWISAFFGFEQKGFNFHGSSTVGIVRMTSQMGMIPVWLEEYRAKDPNISSKNNFLRNVYDRSTILKGTKKEDEIKTYTSRSTLIISGEEHPKDAALISRCIMLPVHRDEEKMKERALPYEWLQTHKGLFSAIGHSIITNKASLWPKIKSRIVDYMQTFSKEETIKTGDRTRIHLSILAGVADTLIGTSEEFSLHVGEMAESQELRVFNDQALNVFYEDVYNLISSGRITTKLFQIKDIKGVTEFHFNFNVAYSEWELNFKGLRNEIPASKTALVDHIKKEKYFIERKNVRWDNGIISAFVFNFNDPKFPNHLKMLHEFEMYKNDAPDFPAVGLVSASGFNYD